MAETETPAEREARVPHVANCDDDGCYCPDDVFWARMLGDDDPCAPGKDWVAAAFGDFPDVVDESGAPCLGDHAGPCFDGRPDLCRDILRADESGAGA